MKALVCEMCGSNDVVKQNGLYICQNCGTKYSVEEAKKLMIEGTVNIQGTVRIDDSVELQNLYELARRAKDTDNCESARKYYEKILEKAPSDWEANFYSIYFKARTCKAKGEVAAAEMIRNSLLSIFELVKKNVSNDQQHEVVEEMFERTSEVTDSLFNASMSRYGDLDDKKRNKYVLEEFCENAESITQIMYDFGDKLEIAFGDTSGNIAVKAWKYGMILHENYLDLLGTSYERYEAESCFREYSSKIRKYEPDCNPQEINAASRGCYIATAVYGSYDCSEVWTLRRFRDNTLDTTWYGRLFIKTYYAVSPTLVKWFGETGWFKKICRIPLDKIVLSLQKKGVASTPYYDKC